MTEYTITELPLVLKTPHKWAEDVIANPIELLNDHAHLEKRLQQMPWICLIVGQPVRRHSLGLRI